jgi:HEAT repeat protein
MKRRFLIPLLITAVMVSTLVALLLYESTANRKAEILLRDMRGDSPNGLEAVYRHLGWSQRLWPSLDGHAEARALADLGQTIIPKLRRELDEDRGASTYAAKALDLLGPKGQRELCEAIGDAHENVRFKAQAALTGRLDDECIRILGGHLKDPGPDVRRYALNALWNAPAIDNELSLRVAGILRSDPDASVRREAASAITRADANNTFCFDLMIERFQDANEDSEVRVGVINAMETLGHVPSHYVPALIRSTKDRAEEVRRAAVKAVGSLLHWHPEVRKENLRTLLAAIVVATADPASSVRAQAAATLGELGTAELDVKDSVKDLRRLASDKDLKVQQVAVWALRCIENKDANWPVSAWTPEAGDR